MSRSYKRPYHHFYSCLWHICESQAFDKRNYNRRMRRHNNMQLRKLEKLRFNQLWKHNIEFIDKPREIMDVWCMHGGGRTWIDVEGMENKHQYIGK